MATIYITKTFTSGTLKGLSVYAAMPGFKSPDDAAKWAKSHKTRPVRPVFGVAPYVVSEASFQRYWR